MRGERNFHVFYELIRGGSDALLDAARLGRDVNSLSSRYLPTATFDMPVPRDDAAEMAALTSALSAADVPDAEIAELFKCIGAILHLGAIGLGGSKSADKSAESRAAVEAGSEATLKTAAELIGCESAALRSALCVRQIRAGSDWMAIPNSAEKVRCYIYRSMRVDDLTWLIP